MLHLMQLIKTSQQYLHKLLRKINKIKQTQIQIQIKL